MKALGCLFALVFILFAFFMAAVGGIWRAIRSPRRPGPREEGSTTHEPRRTDRRRKKKIGKDEGTYIDFEEIK